MKRCNTSAAETVGSASILLRDNQSHRGNVAQRQSVLIQIVALHPPDRNPLRQARQELPVSHKLRRRSDLLALNESGP